MAFAPPQQYNRNNKNYQINNNHPSPHHHQINRTTTPRRVQFSIHNQGSANSDSSNKSLPNLNPLQAQESMPYRPELDGFGSQSQNIQYGGPPKLSKDIKSIEISSKMKQGAIKSNHSTPESMVNEEPIPSPYKQYGNHIKRNNSEFEPRSQLTMNMNTSNSIVVSTNIKKQNLINQESHKINIDNNEEYNIYNHKTQQQYYRQGTISNASYDHIPGLYSINSQTQIRSNNINNNQAPSLPNATSIALNGDDCDNNPDPETKTSQLQLDKHFSNDNKAYETWMACCDIQDDTFGYYSALYPLLCEIFAENTKCQRVPKQSELEEVILKHGATKMKLSQLHEMNNVSGTIIGGHNNNNKDAPITPQSPNNNIKQHMATVSSGSFNHHAHSSNITFDFDNPNSTPKYLVTIKYKSFIKFFKWFKECCKIIRELAHLWDANEQSILQCNLFCGREECQKILDQAPQGTFMLRLSSVIKGGIVLSYCEPSFSKKDKHFKHTILIRRGQNAYELRSGKKSSSSKNNTAKHTTISSVVRSFVKIKFLYTPNNLYPKKSVF